MRQTGVEVVCQGGVEAVCRVERVVGQHCMGLKVHQGAADHQPVQQFHYVRRKNVNPFLD